jgi:hypothetical protein
MILFAQLVNIAVLLTLDAGGKRLELLNHAVAVCE